jgi:hypothetical protein
MKNKNNNEFIPADFEESEREITKEAVIAYERPQRTRERVKKEKKETPPVLKPEPRVYYNEDIAPHNVNRKHFKIALAHARRSLKR